MTEQRQERGKALELMGMPGSPYTRKMLALLRYRNIPYRLEFQSRDTAGRSASQHADRPKARVPLLPTFYLPNAEGVVEAVTDSTLLLRRFEREYQGREVVPQQPTTSFIDAVLEDFADEWLTKAMFHYRWHYQADIDKAAAILPRWGNTARTDEEIAPLSKFIADRQIARLSYVGSNETTKPTIEASFKRYIGLLSAHLAQFPFILGHRPSSADFATYGQLTSLALFDPTPAAIILQTAPRVYAWVETLEDMSGYEPTGVWLDLNQPAPPTLRDLLSEVGRVYIPYLNANLRAVNENMDEVRTTIDGREWTQTPFPYQRKCLHWLCDEYTQLSPTDKAALQDLLAETGLDKMPLL